MGSTLKPESSDYAAIIPCYENGNAVKVVYSHGKTDLIYKSIKSVMRSLERDSSIDIAALRKNYKNCVNRKKLIPIPLSMDTVMIPVRVRKAIAENDGTHAYINIIHLDKILGDKDAVIKLTCGYEVLTLESADTVQRRLNMGGIVRDKYCADVLNNDSMKNMLLSINDEYSKPAVKGDIAMIVYELISIKKKLDSYNNKIGQV